MNAREERGLVIAAMCRLNRPTMAHGLFPRSPRTRSKLAIASTWKRRLAFAWTTRRHASISTRPRASNNETRCQTVTMIETRTVTFTETRVSKQDWRAYNLAQSTEKKRFQELLFDLTRGIEEPPVREGRGNKPHTRKDSHFSTAFKV